MLFGNVHLNYVFLEKPNSLTMLVTETCDQLANNAPGLALFLYANISFWEPANRYLTPKPQHILVFLAGAKLQNQCVHIHVKSDRMVAGGGFRHNTCSFFMLVARHFGNMV